MSRTMSLDHKNSLKASWLEFEGAKPFNIQKCGFALFPNVTTFEISKNRECAVLKVISNRETKRKKKVFFRCFMTHGHKLAYHYYYYLSYRNS